MPDWAAWPFPTEDPYPAYREARAQAPVQWHERLGAHLVLSHEHAIAVLRDPEHWSSDPRNSPEMLDSYGGPGPIVGLLGSSMLMNDPPAHTRLRAAVSRFFTPRAMERIRARVAAIVETAFEPLTEGESIELMSELAYPIPLAVIAELFDVGLEGAQLLRSETPVLARMLELDPSPEEIEAVGTAAMNVVLFLVPIIAQRQVYPGEDLLSALIHPAESGVALHIDEIVTMCLLLLVAGHETTANLIGNGTLALLEHPDQLEWLATHPDRCPQAVEELLRYDSPAQVVPRIALNDLELGGVRVRKGQQVLVVIGAANRDPALSSDPDRLDLARAGTRHLALGNGLHFCVGAGLARLEAHETFRRLAAQLAAHAPDGWSLAREESRAIRRLRALHIGEQPYKPSVAATTPAAPSGVTLADAANYPREAVLGKGA